MTEEIMGKRNQNLKIINSQLFPARVAEPKKTVFGKRYITNNLTHLNCALPEDLQLSCG